MNILAEIVRCGCRSSFVGLAIGLCVHATASAADDLTTKLEDLSAAIVKEPNNASLYITRSDLHRRNSDVDAALADLEFAAGLPGSGLRANLLASEMLLALRRYAPAAERADAALSFAADDPRALALKARALVGLGGNAEAAAFFRRAIERSTAPAPDLYVDCARAIAAQGSAHATEAVAVLDQGIKRIGPIVSLELPAIDLELAARRWDAALARVEVLAAASPAKELWLKRKGEILLKAGRTRDARKAFLAALEAIGRLPADVQRLPRTQTLAREIREQMKSPAKRAP